MSDQPPSRPPRERSVGAAARLAASLAAAQETARKGATGPGADAAPASPTEIPPPVPSSAIRHPDRARTRRPDDVVPRPAPGAVPPSPLAARPGPAAPERPGPFADRPVPGRPAAAAAPAFELPAHPSPDPVAEPAVGPAAAPRPRPVALYVAMAVLILAVPLLAWYGARALRTSHNGTLLTGSSNPSSPGYEALVEPTPTALVVQLDAKRQPVSLTLLSLSGPAQKGGAVVFVPLDLKVTTRAFGMQYVRQSFDHRGVPGLSSLARRELGVGFSDVITVDSASLATSVAPVAPLTIDNPVTVTGPKGTTFAAGKLTLQAADVGPYLAASVDGQSDLNRLDRQALVWQAWLAAVHASKKTEAVPGEVSTGLGRYVRGLAAGSFDVATLPVSTMSDGKHFKASDGLARLLLTNAVPFPVSGGTGQRVTVRVLNGAQPGSIPQSILQRIAYSGGQISVIGNYKTFGVQKSRIEYSGVGNAAAVARIAGQLHIGKGTLLPNVGDSINVTVIIGADLLDHPPGLLTAQGVGS